VIEHLQLKSSPSSTLPALGVGIVPSITIFVGPNNSGKSQLLREIHSFCVSGTSPALVLDRLTFSTTDNATALADLEGFRRPSNPGEALHNPQNVFVRINGGDAQIHIPHYISGRTNPNANLNFFSQYHLTRFTVNLDAQARTGLLHAQGYGDLTKPSTAITKLYRDNTKREAWRATVHDALGLYPAITSLTEGKLSVHFGATPPKGERTHEDEIIRWVQSARSIEGVSDGVKAFTGILLQVYGGNPQVIIVDEPEAFLHPAIARRLGKELATAARAENKYIFAATHSADFLMGAIQSGAVVNIVRLTYSNGVATARLLPNVQLKQLMTDPMLRSVGVLSGLFFEHVIVTEGDTDRAFYQEVNERLLSAGDQRAIPHPLFLNAGGNASMHAIIVPLRQLGIPTASIVDIDVVKNGNHSWTRQIEACRLPEPQRPSLDSLRQTTLDALVAAAPAGTVKPRDYFKRHGGVGLLAEPHVATADSLFETLDQYGLFVVRIGEVEAWLKHLGVPAKEDGWRAAIFTAMKSDPSDPEYVVPATGDVWAFVGKVSAWFKASLRRGV
jgi:hypothetical protein